MISRLDRPSVKLKAAALAGVFFAGLVPALRAQDFSADVVYSAVSAAGAQTSPRNPSKLQVSKGKMRLETGGVTNTILLVNADEHTTIALFPLRKAYQYLASSPSEYFRVVDAENACPDWQKASGQKILCEKAGHEMVDGRQTVKYENKSVSGEGSTTAVWVDPALNFVVRWQSADTGAELRNIKPGPQSADLFGIPQGYTVLKPSKKAGRSAAPVR
jgi:hypothetical protein